MEEWKDIQGYEGIYQVNNIGRIRSIERKVFVNGYWRNKSAYRNIPEKILGQSINNRGYARVCFTGGKKEITKQIHRLVALAFIPQITGKLYINHIDGNKLNNKVENLEWCTNKENRDHAVRLGLLDIKGESNYNARVTNQQVLEIRSKHKPRVYGFKKLAIEYNVSVPTIAAIVQRKTWKHI